MYTMKVNLDVSITANKQVKTQRNAKGVLYTSQPLKLFLLVAPPAFIPVAHSLTAFIPGGKPGNKTASLVH